MQRVYGLVDEDLVHQIDEAAGEAKLSRAQWIRLAIETYLYHGGEQLEIDPVKLGEEAETLRTEAVNLRTALIEKEQRIAEIEEALAVKDGELEDLALQLDKLQAKHDQAKDDATQRWEEVRGFKNEISQLKRELEEARSSTQKLRDELVKRQAEAEQARSDAEITKAKFASYKDSLMLKDDEISFLRAHVHQLSEKLPKAIPATVEEEDKRSRWKFWRRG